VVTDPGGEVLTSPLRRGEPVTDARLAGNGTLTGLPAGMVAVPLRLSDPGVVAWLRPGDRVDVLAAPGAVGDTVLVDATATADVLATDAIVLGVGGGRDGTAAQRTSGDSFSSGDTLGLVVVAVDRSTAPRLASSTGRQVVVTITGE
jgi:Flp pilus assembly protein CpaB